MPIPCSSCGSSSTVVAMDCTGGGGGGTGGGGEGTGGGGDSGPPHITYNNIGLNLCQSQTYNKPIPVACLAALHQCCL